MKRLELNTSDDSTESKGYQDLAKKVLEMSDEDLLKSLHFEMISRTKSEQSITPEDFKARLIYLLIERANDALRRKGKFSEDIFDDEVNKESKEFFKTMKRAFLFVLLHSNKQHELTTEFIDSIYDITSKSILNPSNRKYRNQSHNMSSGLETRHASASFIKTILKDKKVKYDLLPEEVAGEYHIKQNGDPETFFVLKHSSRSESQIKDIMKRLIDAYNQKISKIKDVSDEKSQEQKIRLIGSLIGDMMKLHPYKNGNGRTFCFTLLNHLLVKEGLTPCMIFDPWHLEHSDPEERYQAIIEGQEAYKKYLIGGNSVDLEKPLSAKVVEMSSPFPSENTLKNIPSLLLLYLKSKILKKSADTESQEDKKNKLQSILGNTKSGEKTNQSMLSDIKNMQSLPDLPIAIHDDKDDSQDDHGLLLELLILCAYTGHEIDPKKQISAQITEISSKENTPSYLLERTKLISHNSEDTLEKQEAYDGDDEEKKKISIFVNSCIEVFQPFYNEGKSKYNAGRFTFGNIFQITKELQKDFGTPESTTYKSSYQNVSNPPTHHLF